MMRPPSENVPLTIIDDVEVFLCAPGCAEYGLYRKSEDCDFHGDPCWEIIPVTAKQRNDLERLRMLRMEAARISGGNLEQASAIYRFLKSDAA
jgi:hypothetical protein